MRFFVLVCGICTLTSPAAHAQWQVQYVPLPDSMSGLNHPRTVFYNPGNNTIFVSGSGDYMFALDGVTNRKIARIPVLGPTGPMCYNPVENKLYVLQDDGYSILVIDAAANRAIRTLPFGSDAGDLCYNPLMNRVYVTFSASVVRAIDCRSDSVVAVVRLPSASEDICCVTRGNKVYCVMVNDDVAVIDCSRDSVVKTFYTGAGPYEMLYNHRSNRVYISEGYDEDVTVVDAVRDSVIRWLPAGFDPDTLCLNTGMNKVYVIDSDGDWLTIIDCDHDSVMRPRFIGDYHTGITYDSLDNLVYLALSSDSVAVLDGRTDSVINQFATAGRPAGMCYNPRQNLVYVAEEYASAVGVYQGLTNAWIAEPRFWCGLGTMVHRPAQDEVWGATGQKALAVFSPAMQRVDRYVRVGVSPTGLFHVPELDKTYIGTYSYDDTLPVVHCAQDSVTLIAGVGGNLRDLCYVPGSRKVYSCSSYDSALTVIDADGDSVLRRLLPGTAFNAVEYSAEYNHVYAASYDRSMVQILDATTDSVIAYFLTSMPEQLLHVPEHRLLLCVGNSGRLLRAVSTDSNRIIGTLWFASAVRGMVAGCPADEVYLSVDTSIAIFDIPSLTIRTRIPVHMPAAWMTVDTVARRLYCVGGNSHRLVVVDLRGDSVMAGPAVDSGFSVALGDQEHRRLYLSYPSQSMLAMVTDTAHVGIAGNGVKATRVGPTIVRGVLWLRDCQPASTNEAGGCPQPTRAALLDISGRKVADLRPGANDVRGLAPGVYFVRPAGTVPAGQGTVPIRAKVVVTR